MFWAFEELIDGREWYRSRPEERYPEAEMRLDMLRRQAGRPFKYEILSQTATEIIFRQVWPDTVPEELPTDRPTFRWRRLRRGQP